jgi:hypothetical protein
MKDSFDPHQQASFLGFKFPSKTLGVGLAIKQLIRKFTNLKKA